MEIVVVAATSAALALAALAVSVLLARRQADLEAVQEVLGRRQADLQDRVVALEDRSAGLQDRVIQVYEGFVYMDFERSHQEKHGYGIYEELVPPKVPPLQP